MKQYYSIKAVHPDAILLFRVGDFYETFGEDAIKASGILGITLTRRANGSATYVELAGFPYHAIDTYLPKLVRAGERVAICEQLEDPKQVRGLVKRGVIELVTPGVVLGDNILANKENAFLASVYFGRQTTGVAFLDISTGEFYAAEGSESLHRQTHLQPRAQGGHLPARLRRPFFRRFRVETLYLPPRRMGFLRGGEPRQALQAVRHPLAQGIRHRSLHQRSSRPPGRFSTTSNSPSTVTSRTSPPYRVSIRRITSGSISSRSATSNSSRRTAPARSAVSPTSSTVR